MTTPDTPIEIFRETTTPPPFPDTRVLEIIETVCRGENRSVDWLEVVYVDTDAMCELHLEFFDDASPTDSIALQYNLEADERVEGTIYQCGPHIAAQAGDFGASIPEEFTRVLIHGLLHLMGYRDSNAHEQAQMRERERHYLTELGFKSA